MNHRGRYGSIDYARIAKSGFLLGVVLLLVGALAEYTAHEVLAPVPEWELQLFFSIEVAGVLIGFFVPIVFGIVLPLTE